MDGDRPLGGGRPRRKNKHAAGGRRLRETEDRWGDVRSATDQELYREDGVTPRSTAAYDELVRRTWPERRASLEALIGLGPLDWDDNFRHGTEFTSTLARMIESGHYMWDGKYVTVNGFQAARPASDEELPPE